jgi:hypothetical protein
MTSTVLFLTEDTHHIKHLVQDLAEFLSLKNISTL